MTSHPANIRRFKGGHLPWQQRSNHSLKQQDKKKTGHSIDVAIKKITADEMLLSFLSTCQ